MDGTLEVQDEDEFEVHQVLYGYSDEMISKALQATDDVLRRLEDREEPFFDVAAVWLARLASAG
jgi:protein associated with RNAse G/E